MPQIVPGEVLDARQFEGRVEAVLDVMNRFARILAKLVREDVRVDVWPLLRAVPQRALLLLRALLCVGTRSATQERE